MVYVSPSQKGWMPRSWQPVFDDENLIWISANSSGNEEIVAKRMLYAVLAPQIAAVSYKIDPARVYLSGFSGGGKVAGMVAVNFANIFKGAIYICGAEYWIDDPPKLFSEVKNNRYVFLTGSEDFNRDLTYKIYRKYKSAGVSNIELINVPQMTHSNPDTRYFLKAINYLDQRE
jgi:predicted peptidase